MARLYVFTTSSADHLLKSLDLVKLTPDLVIIHSHLVDLLQ